MAASARKALMLDQSNNRVRRRARPWFRCSGWSVPDTTNRDEMRAENRNVSEPRKSQRPSLLAAGRYVASARLWTA
jgi:hypothetical protein